VHAFHLVEVEEAQEGALVNSGLQEVEVHEEALAGAWVMALVEGEWRGLGDGFQEAQEETAHVRGGIPA
jgi:hypothetical protein